MQLFILKVINFYFFSLQKWTIENSKLPEHLQRTMPQKPEVQNISIDDWNQLAWEATQVCFQKKKNILSGKRQEKLVVKKIWGLGAKTILMTDDYF